MGAGTAFHGRPREPWIGKLSLRPKLLCEAAGRVFRITLMHPARYWWAGCGVLAPAHKKGKDAGTTPTDGLLQPNDGSCSYAQARLRHTTAGMTRVSDKFYTIIEICCISTTG